MRLIKLSLWLFLATLALLTQPGCGFDFGLDGVWDDHCYDCRTVCEGTVDDALNTCLSACSQCQGSSECFALIEGRFVGMANTKDQWTEVDCALLE